MTGYSAEEVLGHNWSVLLIFVASHVQQAFPSSDDLEELLGGPTIRQQMHIFAFLHLQQEARLFSRQPYNMIASLMAIYLMYKTSGLLSET